MYICRNVKCWVYLYEQEIYFNRSFLIIGSYVHCLFNRTMIALEIISIESTFFSLTSIEKSEPQMPAQPIQTASEIRICCGV